MTIRETIERDYLQSMRAKDAQRTGTLRLVRNSMKNAAIEQRLPVEELTDEQMIAIIRRETKKRRESIEAYTNGGRPELAEQERAELALLQSYLPAGLSDTDLQRLIADVASEERMAQPYNFGRLMGAVVRKVAGRADGDTVREQVQKFIS